MVLITRTLDKVDWDPHPRLPATHRVLAVSTQTLCYLRTVCYGPGTEVELSKIQPRSRITITGLMIEICVLIKQGFSSRHNFILKTFLIKLSFISSLEGFVNKVAAPQSLFYRLLIDTITIAATWARGNSLSCGTQRQINMKCYAFYIFDLVVKGQLLTANTGLLRLHLLY